METPRKRLSKYWCSVPHCLSDNTNISRPVVFLSLMLTLTLIFGHKLHIGTPYRGKRFWTHQIPTSCLPILLIFIHIEHTFCICPFLVTFFSATIDDRNLIFGHMPHIGTPYRGKRFLTRQIPTSCLPKSGGIISEH